MFTDDQNCLRTEALLDVVPVFKLMSSELPSSSEKGIGGTSCSHFGIHSHCQMENVPHARPDSAMTPVAKLTSRGVFMSAEKTMRPSFGSLYASYENQQNSGLAF